MNRLINWCAEILNIHITLSFLKICLKYLKNTLTFIILLNLYYLENADLVFAGQLLDCFRHKF
jgi:hypothetical protein